MFVAIVPAYNEQERIGSVVRSLFGHVDEVVVVDDCSSDKTSQVAREFGATVIRHRLNRGQGAALETGHEYARQSGALYVLHFDGDGQMSVEDILPALESLKRSEADILLGSRFLGKESNMPFFKKYILGPVSRLIDRFFSKIKLSDAHNGFRILNQNALSKIVITQDRMAHASEIPMLIHRHNLKYIEFPVKVTYHEYGQSPLAGFSVLKDLIIGTFVKKK